MNGRVERPNVAIVGRPNVGKSELFNRLVGRKIAIVHDQPGITRDRISAVCHKGARPFTLWDTGGVVGAGETELIEQVRQTAEQAIAESQLLLFVVDARQGLSPMDEELGRRLRKARRPIVLVVNKIDDPKHEELISEFNQLGFENIVAISAAHGRGILELLEAIDGALENVRDQNSEALPEKICDEDRRPTSIAVIGRPNAGKSSLINAVVKDERAIVSELPGTTRDAVDISFRNEHGDFVFIDTAGIRRRGRHSSSAEVFSVMRSERSIRRADLSVLIVDLTTGFTAQDKRIAGLIQKARKPSIVILNKWDLIRPKRAAKDAMLELIEETRRRAFFIDYAPILVTSARTGESVEKLFGLIGKIRRSAQKRIGTGILNRRLRAAFAANPPPMVSGRRLKLFYAAQSSGKEGATSSPPFGRSVRAAKTGVSSSLMPPEFVLFVNEPRLLNDSYRRYLEAQIRQIEPYIGLPVILTLRPRAETRKSDR